MWLRVGGRDVYSHKGGRGEGNIIIFPSCCKLIAHTVHTAHRSLYVL